MIRPFFPIGLHQEVQVTTRVLRYDGKQDPDLLAANAASMALMLSNIPWSGPIGMIRIGRINGKYIVNPIMEELSLSDLNLLYACTRDKTMMIDVQAREISERDLEIALRLAHKEAIKYLIPQVKLANKFGLLVGKKMGEYKLFLESKTVQSIIQNLESKFEDGFANLISDQVQSKWLLDKIAEEVKKAIEEDGDEETIKHLSDAIALFKKPVLQKKIIRDGLYRVDHRTIQMTRDVYCEAGCVLGTYGSSSIFLGDDSVLSSIKILGLTDASWIPATKRFRVSHRFEDDVGDLNRREIEHEIFAEKALLGALSWVEKDMPCRVLVDSEASYHNGSYVMSAICGGSIALFDAGIHLRGHVACVSMGLVTESDPSTGNLKYHILTDIEDLEAELGDMIFKIAGTRDGITAAQLDVKASGIPLRIIFKCLEAA